jgi:hypothetical protein
MAICGLVLVYTENQEQKAEQKDLKGMPFSQKRSSLKVDKEGVVVTEISAIKKLSTILH